MSQASDLPNYITKSHQDPLPPFPSSSQPCGGGSCPRRWCSIRWHSHCTASICMANLEKWVRGYEMYGVWVSSSKQFLSQVVYICLLAIYTWPHQRFWKSSAVSPHGFDTCRAEFSRLFQSIFCIPLAVHLLLFVFHPFPHPFASHHKVSLIQKAHEWIGNTYHGLPIVDLLYIYTEECWALIFL